MTVTTRLQASQALLIALAIYLLVRGGDHVVLAGVFLAQWLLYGALRRIERGQVSIVEACPASGRVEVG